MGSIVSYRPRPVNLEIERLQEVWGLGGGGGGGGHWVCESLRV